MLESLTVMGVDSEDSRERRAPWGVLKFLKAREKSKPRAVSFEIDKLMIWVPAPCAIAIAKDMAATSANTSTSYRVERGSEDPASDRRFSFYAVNVSHSAQAATSLWWIGGGVALPRRVPSLNRLSQ